ncbi:rod shape-determining protein MreC [Nocardioides sp. zg-DK7169]|uniref:rod shape-determining protein MreC n=1 Tax=Nocardioides sp. zg-DK7169 TaxID=2736600 RepID=UPI001551EAF1|nr:rod shape-determining protein MreC [Nocardioides sp. zg-DK7169]NPC97721.1 rod shape-determining protein MreC [Nocardioides sp. zg-DK7169]
MALDGLDQRRSRERRWRSASDLERPRGPRRSVAVALVLACVTLMTLDQQTDPVVEPARRALGEVIGPVEVGASALLRPFVSIPDWFRSHGDLRGEIDALEAENARLRSQVSTADYDRNRLAEYDGLTRAASDLGYALVPARVVGLGPSQSFSATVTIDAGSEAGLRADMTVVNNDGLVGRVLRVTRTTATVLLAIDPESVVGGRIGSSMEIGFLHGRGALGDEARLDLELLDEAVVPGSGDAVVTWGSRNGAPYVSGIPVGEVTAVFSNVRDSSQRAVVRPYVDFASLDVVGVVVPSGSESDRAVIEADGSMR